MKSTGVVRKIDMLGRFVLPIELRRTFDLKIGDPVEIYTDDDKIVLKKYQNSCVFCGSTKDVIRFKDKAVCHMCMKSLYETEA